MKKFKILLPLLLLVLIFTACESKTDVSKIQEAGVIRMGTEAGYPPYEYTVVEDGKQVIVGFDIEIGELIAKELGVELEIVDMDFDGLLPALAVGDVDMVIAGMNPNPEREESANFSQSYYNDEQMMLIREPDADLFKTPADFAGKKVGAQLGTIQENIADEEFPDSEKLAMPEIANMVMELKSGNIDGILLVKPVAMSYAANNDELVLADFSLGDEADEGVSIAVAKNQSELLEIINGVLDEIKEDGTLDQLVEEYFSEPVAE